jgi:acyl-CoA thioesterase-2
MLRAMRGAQALRSHRTKTIPMPSAVAEVLSLFELQEIAPDRFQGNSQRTAVPNMFGGQMIGQALAAAGRTIEDGRPASLHCNFLAPADDGAPVQYKVDRLRDGRGFTVRWVLASQNERALFAATISFVRNERGLSGHQFAMPKVPPPEELQSGGEIGAILSDRLSLPAKHFFSNKLAIDLRPVERSRYAGTTDARNEVLIWLRATERLPDDPFLHACLLAYTSDMTLLDVVLAPLGRTFFDGSIMPASLDHTLWFHRDFRIDDWMLFAQDSPSLADGRGLSRGLIFARDGRLVASVAQEGVLRETA